MEIYCVTDPAFRPYGRILPQLDTAELLATLPEVSPCPEDGAVYVPSVPALEALPVFSALQDGVYGGMPTQLGYCNGRNHTMNCLEYHRGSEVNLCTTDMILLLALQSDMDDAFHLDSSCVKAFRVPAGVAILVYETTLHYAPIGDAFRCAVVLPRGTNTAIAPSFAPVSLEDRLLFATNKWLISHPDASAAASGAYIGISGDNIVC